MNNRIKELMDQAEFTGDRYALPLEFAEEFAQLLVRDVLTTIVELNLTQGVYTTYDSGVSESSRQEIVRAVKDRYGVIYNTMPASAKLFPVKGVR